MAEFANPTHLLIDVLQLAAQLGLLPAPLHS
jgi:hypothetical protein